MLEKYQYQVAGDVQKVNYYAAQIRKAEIYDNASREYLEAAGRYLASGQAKINEMLVMLGVKTEFPTQKAASEQRA